MPAITASPTKLAPNHAKVYDALQHAGRPVTAYEIIDAVRSAGISAPPTVYRALNRLIELGLAHRLESLNAFVACAHEDEHQGESHLGSVVFLICNKCGETKEVVDHSLEQCLRQASSNNSFHPAQATIELRGQCDACGRDTCGSTS